MHEPHGKLNVVLVAMRGRLAYDVLRALHGMRARVQLICDCRSSIRMSRYCETLYASRDLGNESQDRVVEVINQRHRRDPIDTVLASDVDGATLLNRIRTDLTPPVFPAPDTPTLALLNNKWRFQQLCVALGIAAPESLFFESKERLDPARIESELGYPVVVKPVDRCGGDGVIVAESADAVSVKVISNPRYVYGAGFIVQRYVRGRDWGYIAFARDGRIDVALTFACGPNWRTEIRHDPGLLDAARRIIEHVRYTGVVNFDCRLDDETSTFKFLECNPRFCRRVTATRLCGLNFVEAGLGRVAQPPAEVSYFPLRDVFTRDGVRSLAHGQWPLSIVGATIFETASDPIPGFMRKFIWQSAAQRVMSPLLQRLVRTRL
jgi:biotin carboxylase